MLIIAVMSLICDVHVKMCDIDENSLSAFNTIISTCMKTFVHSFDQIIAPFRIRIEPNYKMYTNQPKTKEKVRTNK